MATFRIGQRVRIIGSASSWKHMIGKQATITSIESDNEYGIDIDGVPSSPEGKKWSAFSYHLAPLYDGHVVTTWEKCLWHPLHGHIDENEATSEYKEGVWQRFV
jgi:DNA-binding transcriptional ArsR family regulator